MNIQRDSQMRVRPLRSYLAIPHILLFCFVMIVFSVIMYRYTRSTKSFFLESVSQQVAANTNDMLHRFFAEAPRIAEGNRERMRVGLAHPQDDETLGKIFVTQLHQSAHLTYVSFGRANGEYIGGSRHVETGAINLSLVKEADGMFFNHYAVTAMNTRDTLIEKGEQFDARARGWFTQAQQSREMRWYPVYKYAAFDALGTGVSAPLYDSTGTKLLGVCTADLSLHQISDYLKSINLGKNGIAYLAEHSGKLLAVSTDTSVYRTVNSRIERYGLDDYPDPRIRAVGKHSHDTLVQRFFTIKNDRYFLRTVSFTDSLGLDLQIGIILAERDYSDVFTRNQQGASVLILLVGILLVFVENRVAKQLSIPIEKLTKQAVTISQGDFSHSSDILYPTLEMQNLSDAFARMSIQLKDTFDSLEERVEDRTEKLFETESRFHTIFEQANTGIVFADSTGIISFCNDAFAKILGYRADELVGKTVASITVTDDYPQNRRLMDELIAGQRDHYRIEKRYYHQDRSIIWGDLSVSILRGKSGKEISIVGMVVDITDRKRAEEELRVARDQAEQANLAKSEFIANISHEIRTPINAVVGFSELLEKEITNTRQKGHLSAIRSAGKNLLVLINDILDLSKIESGKMDVVVEPTDIRSLMREIDLMFQLQCESIELRLTTSVFPEVPELIVVDHAHLRQIIVNLVGNAVKFTEKGGVTIDVSYHEKRLQIAVRDTGIGIAEDQQETIFEKFRQHDGQSRRKYGGTGLGLSISRKLIELIGGTVSLESTLGVGSTFTIELTVGEAVLSKRTTSPVNLVVQEEMQKPLSTDTPLLLSADDVQSLEQFAIELDRAVSPIQFSEVEDIARRLIDLYTIPEIQNFAYELLEQAGAMDISVLVTSPRRFRSILGV